MASHTSTCCRHCWNQLHLFSCHSRSSLESQQWLLAVYLCMLLRPILGKLVDNAYHSWFEMRSNSDSRFPPWLIQQHVSNPYYCHLPFCSCLSLPLALFCLPFVFAFFLLFVLLFSVRVFQSYNIICVLQYLISITEVVLAVSCYLFPMLAVNGILLWINRKTGKKETH